MEEQLLYRVMYEDGELYGVSIVDDPANGFNFVALSEQKVEIKLSADKKKQILYGIVLRADQKITRVFEDGTPYLIFFDAETIEKYSQDFLDKGYQKNTSYNHEKMDGWLGSTTIVENWIVADGNNDKGNSIGLEVQTGDWVCGMKLNDEAWSNYIETGKAKGFSIDSFVRFERINYKKVNHTDVEAKTSQPSEKNKKNNMSTIKKLIEMFSEGAELASIEVEGVGTLTVDEFVEGNIVYNEDLTPFVGEFVYDNKTYVTDPEGLLISITEVEEVVEEIPEEVVVEEKAVEASKEVEAPQEDFDLVDFKKENEINLKSIEDLNKKLEEIENKNIELKSLNESLITENEELKKQPNSQKIKASDGGENISPLRYRKVEKRNETQLQSIERLVSLNKKNKNK